MAKSDELLEIPELGIEVRVVERGADTGGERCAFEIAGRPRGFLTQEHAHAAQTERLEPLSGSMKVVMAGRTHVLNPGDVLDVPPGTPHTQEPMGAGAGTVRITHTPAGPSEAFLEKLAALSRDGRLLKSGYPRPTAAAELVLEHGDAGLAAKPSPTVQRRIPNGILGARRRGAPSVSAPSPRPTASTC